MWVEDPSNLMERVIFIRSFSVNCEYCDSSNGRLVEEENSATGRAGARGSDRPDV